MSGIKVHSSPVRQLLARRFAPPDAKRQANSSPKPTALSSVPVKPWETAGFEVCVASGATVNSRGEARVLRSAGGAASRPTFTFPRRRSRSWRLGGLALALIAMCLSITATAIEVRPERWRWSNPLPHGNNVLDMLVASDVAVQVGDGGTVYVQGLDERWAPALDRRDQLPARCCADGRSVSRRWREWLHSVVRRREQLSAAQVLPATANWFEGVAASAQRAVAVGDNGAIYTSTNGTNWAQSTSGTSEWLRGVAFGGGTFVAVGENGTILRSTSGTSWSKTTSGTAHLNRVRYLGTGGAGQILHRRQRRRRALQRHRHFALDLPEHGFNEQPF